ncbi:MAG: hypothetical protein Q7U36_03550 [bacterium]|nr:hypothetical protein [bacterium]
MKMITGITMNQTHTFLSALGTGADWVYLEKKFSLQCISESIEKNPKVAGSLFTEFVLRKEIKQEKQKNKEKVFSSSESIIFSNKILRLIAENIQWERIDFNRDQIQYRIIRNTVGSGKAFTEFLISLMTNPDLELV